MTDKKFVIAAPSWFPSSGGITILHKLANTLNELGYDAYIAPSGPSGLGWHPDSVPFNSPSRYDKIKFITDEVYHDLHNAIVVYPETWYGNFLNAPNVVRWILGPANPTYMTPGKWGSLEWDGWKDTDLWFWYNKLYTTSAFNTFDKNLDNRLYIGEFFHDIFYNRNEERTIDCWTLRKATGLITPDDYIHKSGDLFFGDIDKSLPNPDYDFPGNFKALSDLFNRTNKFYSYDSYTFLTIQALMCGAEAIVYPKAGLSKEDYFNGYTLHKYVAYGLDDLERARSVKNEFNSHVDMIEQESIQQIHEFVNKCYDYFK